MARTKLRWEFPTTIETIHVPELQTDLRNCLHGYNDQGKLCKTLYCTRDGRFFVHYPDGWHEQKPIFGPAMRNYKGGSVYPNMRNFGNKLCHCLMAHAWLGARPEGMEIDHLNGNKLDWSADNLQYVTTAENIRRSKLLKRMRKIGLQPKWLYYGTLRQLYSLPHEQAERVIAQFPFEAGTRDDALTIERINMTFAYLFDELTINN